MNTIDDAPADTEHRFHDYRTNKIPWFVRLLWVGFWAIAAVYLLRFLIPQLQIELFQR